jgi:4-amino-4-deoxy-L-arabinose transferase-like glycosyltransferase
MILAVALLLRLTAAVWWQRQIPEGQQFLLPDSHSYWYLASALAHGEPYQFGGRDARIFRTPGYPLLLAPILALLGDGPAAIWAARVAGAGLGVLTVGLTICWARLLLGRRASLWAGAMAAVYPGLIGLSVMVLSEALFCPLMVAQLLCWSLAEVSLARTWQRVWSGLAGVTCGAAILTRPSWLLFLPLAVVVGLLWSRNRRVPRLWNWAVMCAACLLIMLPWWIRNYRVAGHFVPSTLQAGASLYDGWNPRASGASNMWFTAEYARRVRADAAAGRLPPNRSLEYELDQRLQRDALTWAGEHPARALQLAGVKLLRLWNVWPNDEQFRSLPLRLAVALTYVPLLVLAAWGMRRLWRNGWPAPLCLFPVLYLTLLHMVFVSSIRYREPAMLGVMLAAAAAMAVPHELRRQAAA